MVITGQMRGNVGDAIRLWEECSRAGHGWAKANLAKALVDGKLIYPPDVDRALMLYQEAWNSSPVLSESHPHTAALNLADLYMKLGKQRDAVHWLHKAADEAYDILAQYQLGHAYSYGKFGLPVDTELAFKYTRRAADGGFVLAQHNLGCLYIEGVHSEEASKVADGVDKSRTTITGSPTRENIQIPDYVAAAYYFSKAHYQQYYWSTINLAVLFARGRGVPQNMVTARLLIKEVAEFGSDQQKSAAKDVQNTLDRLEAGQEIAELPLRNRVEETPGISFTPTQSL